MPLQMFSNPFALAAVAIFAIGVVVYEIVSRQQEKTHSHKPRSSPPPSPPSHKPWSPPPTRPKKPEEPPSRPKEPGKPPSPPSRTPSDLHFGSGDSNRKHTNSSLRKRNNQKALTSDEYRENTNETTPKNKIKDQSVASSHLSGERQRQTTITSLKNDTKEKLVASDPLQSEGHDVSSNTCHQNMAEKNYEKNVFDRMIYETKCVNMESEKSFNKNISDEDSDSENNVSENSDAKLCNTDLSVQTISLDNSNDSVQKNQTEEEIYKENVFHNLMNDVENRDQNAECEEIKPTCSGASEAAVKVKAIPILNAGQNICHGCEEEPCTAVAYPCGHRYLCADCAKRVFRIYKTCIICHGDVEKFEY